jgi:hypothetical protein
MIKSRRMRWAGHVARMGRREKHIGYWWKSQKERDLGRPRRRWVDNIKIDLREIGRDGVNWIDLAQDKDQWGGSCEHGDEPSGFLKCWEVPEWLHNWQLLRKG